MALRSQQTALTLREYALRYELLLVVDGLTGACPEL